MNCDLSIVIACRNERAHIGTLAACIANQDLDGIDWEAIFADGMSNDGTREILQDICGDSPRMRLLDNPGQIVSAGLNRAIIAAHGEVVIRMDAHTSYAPDYCRRCLEALAGTGADNVGGPARTRPVGLLSAAICAAYHSRFSTGGARFHDAGYEGWVDTVPYGCWKRETLDRLGLFDESLIRNQDDELNLRIVRSGGRIWQDPKIVSWYTPRSSLSALFRQYMQYGFWKVAVIRKHRAAASWRHLVPVCFALINLVLVTIALGAAFASASTAFALAAGAWCALLFAYAIATLLASAVAALEHGWKTLPLLPVVFATFHLSYGAGFLAGLLCPPATGGQRAYSPQIFTRLTR